MQIKPTPLVARIWPTVVPIKREHSLSAEKNDGAKTSSSLSLSQRDG